MRLHRAESFRQQLPWRWPAAWGDGELHSQSNPGGSNRLRYHRTSLLFSANLSHAATDKPFHRAAHGASCRLAPRTHHIPE